RLLGYEPEAGHSCRYRWSDGGRGLRWPSRLVATAAENSQRSAFEAVATWLSANAPSDITSATRRSLRLWSLAYDLASALLANRPIIWFPHIKTVMGIANYRTSSLPALGLGCCDRCHRLLFE